MSVGARIGAVVGARVGAAAGINQDPISSQGRSLIIVGAQSNGALPGWGDASTHAAPGIIEPQRSGVGNSFPPVNARTKASWTTADPPVWHIDSTAALAGVNSSVNNPTGHNTNLIGFQQSMLRHLDYYRPNSWDVATMAITATSLAVHWLPTGNYPTAQTNLFGQMLALADAAAASFGSTPAVFVWCQGESDGADPTQAAAYQTNLTALFAAVRAHWPGIAIVFNELSSANTNATQSATIRAAQVAVQAATSNCTLVNVDDLALQSDHAHFTSDACNALGDRFANAIVNLLGIPSPVPWTIDKTMLVACPANLTEWQQLIAAANAKYGAGITSTGPGSIVGCQDASSPLVDALGAHNMGATGAGTELYRAANNNWERFEVVTPNGNTRHWENTDASLPDPATTSCAIYAYCYWTQGAAAANMWGIGTAGLSTVQRQAQAPTFNPWLLFEGGTSTTSSTQVTPGSRLGIHCRNVTSGKVDAMNDIDHIQANVGTVTGKRVTMGAGASGLGNCFQEGFFYWTFWPGAAGELTVAQWRAIALTANWGNTNLGMPAIPW